MKNKLPGLNGLRAIAASLVLIEHALQLAGYMGEDRAAFLSQHGFLHNKWFDMVNLFFVISGFIITLLLLIEKESTGTIDLKGFYVRRFLRIWPLYFFIFIAVGIIGLTSDVYGTFDALNDRSVLVISLFVVTLNPFIGAPMSVLPHYWSLSVEEQYYLFVPLLVRRFKVIQLSLLIIAGMILLRNGSALLAHFHGFFAKLNEYLVASKFSSMAIGAIGAYLYKECNRFVTTINKPVWRWLIWAIFAAGFFVRVFIPYINSEIQAVLYALLVLTAVQGGAYFLLNNRLIELTGQISYGIYMYHVPLVPLLYYGLNHMGLMNWFAQGRYIPFILLCYIVTFGVAYCSYFYFEKNILKLKGRIYRLLNIATTA